MLSRELCQKLKNVGFPQKDGKMYYLLPGFKYGDGYRNTAYDLTPEMILEIGDSHFGQGERTAGEKKTYSGGIKFDAIFYPEYDSDNYVQFPMEACVKIPTLSELIEACPELLSLTRQKDGRWFAYSRVDDGQGNNIEMCLNTPEEAVANLYLELHQDPHG